jgi:hypothetical protein
MFHAIERIRMQFHIIIQKLNQNWAIEVEGIINKSKPN